MIVKPMLALSGEAANLKADEWAFEGKWDGYRVIVEVDGGNVRITSRSGRDVTADYPQLRQLVNQNGAFKQMTIDGEAVVIGKNGQPDFNAMQNHRRGEVQLWAFDLLELDGRPLLHVAYRERRKLLELLAQTLPITVPGLIDVDHGGQALEYAQQQQWEGVVCKRWDSTYKPGQRSPLWVKTKNWCTQEVVIGGWLEGKGHRSGGIGSLLMGIPNGGGLTYVGKVGTGFTGNDLDALHSLYAPLATATNPFGNTLRVGKGMTFVEPVTVGEVRFMEWTKEATLRHPSWRGLRTDKGPQDVVRE